MSKKRKSRFTKTDVNAICEMQRKIDAYEDFIIALNGMVRRKDPSYKYICFVKNVMVQDNMDDLWSNCEELIKVYNEHKG